MKKEVQDNNKSFFHFSRTISPPPGLHIVSERTKQFESGRPLSPDGSSVDRTSLYRSELSRYVIQNHALYNFLLLGKILS